MGKVIMSGIVPYLKAPITGILASELVVGSVVKLIEDGVAVEYLVVNQGIPSGSSMYDSSCDGMWLIRKDIKEKRQWHSSNVNDYKNSTIHAWLNGDFFNLFGAVEQATIKQVKIPYVNGTGSSGTVASGVNGISANIFLLSGYEVGFTTNEHTAFPVDGAKLSYFVSGDGTDARKLRIGYLNGTTTLWWFRSPNNQNTTTVLSADTDGGRGDTQDLCTASMGIRPALVLPSNALFDTNTLILKGVA